MRAMSCLIDKRRTKKHRQLKTSTDKILNEKRPNGTKRRMEKGRLEPKVENFPFDIMSNSAYIIHDNIFVRHYFPFDILSHSTFITVDLIYFKRFTVHRFFFRLFVPIDVLSVDVSSCQRFILQQFACESISLWHSPALWNCK